jgi:hypothetical protein
MQTFLPYADFRRCARVLDVRRLGKQRVEVLQILRAGARTSGGWVHHPAVLMWRGYEEALARYGLDITQRWCALGHADTCAVKITDDYRTLYGGDTVRTQRELRDAGALPPWLGNRALHRSHQSSLVRKDPAHYRQFFPSVPDDLPYVWPVTAASLTGK